MKKYLIYSQILSSIFLFNILLNAQILNNSFETWGSEGDPVDWITNNLTGLAIGITPSNDAYDGLFSAKLEIQDFSGFPHPAILQSFSGDTYGQPINDNYGSLTGYYKFVPVSNVEFSLTVGVHDAQAQLIGIGGMSTPATASDWTMLVVPIEYFPGAADASTIIISVSVAPESGSDINSIGSYALVDYFNLGDPTGIETGSDLPDEYVLNQNYPNPFNPTTTIQYEIPHVRNVETTGPVVSPVSLRIYDVLGREIKTLVNEYQSPGTYEIEFNAANLESGVYFYRLQSGNFNAVKKLILLK